MLYAPCSTLYAPCSTLYALSSLLFAFSLNLSRNRHTLFKCRNRPRDRNRITINLRRNGRRDPNRHTLFKCRNRPRNRNRMTLFKCRNGHRNRNRMTIMISENVTIQGQAPRVFFQETKRLFCE